jgi:hypothetical protein
MSNTLSKPAYDAIMLLLGRIEDELDKMANALDMPSVDEWRKLDCPNVYEMKAMGYLKGIDIVR